MIKNKMYKHMFTRGGFYIGCKEVRPFDKVKSVGWIALFLMLFAAFIYLSYEHNSFHRMPGVPQLELPNR
jgi:hypothetical protein